MIMQSNNKLTILSSCFWQLIYNIYIYILQRLKIVIDNSITVSKIDFKQVF